MPQTDPYSKYIVSPAPAPPSTTEGAPSSSDPYSKYIVSPAPASTPSVPPPGDSAPSAGQGAAPSEDPYARFAVSGPGAQQPPTSASPLQGGQSAPPAATDSGAPWYKRAWDWANTPLVDGKRIASWLGRDNASGWEKGVYDLAGGLTSPLSIALTIGTLPFGGEGGLLESGGAAALREAGLAPGVIDDVAKGSQVIAKAVKNGKTFEEGMQAAEQAGVSRAVLEDGLKKLADSGLTSESLHNSGIVHQAGSAALRGLGLNPAQAERVAKGVQLLTTAGFTTQTAYAAVVASPRVLDALKDGDYDQAEELAVQALGSGAFAYLGARSFMGESGALMDDLKAKSGLEAPNTPENDALRKNFGVYDADTTQVARAEKLWADDIRKRYPEVKTPEQLQRVMNLMQAGLDEDVMAARYNALAEAAGDSSRLPVSAAAPGAGSTPSSNWIMRGAADYAKQNGTGPVTTQRYAMPDPRVREIADAYKAMQHDPTNPAVARSYAALADEIGKQWDYATQKMGVTFEPWTKEGQPYQNSAEMMKDVQDNKHLYFFRGGEIPADHPLAADAGDGLTYNDKLRAVHDLFGHAMEGYEFGPRGEENAWRAHAQMFSPEAVPALTSETKGQNSWVNSGSHLRDADGNVIQPGEPGYIPPDKRPFAEQKAGLLPAKYQTRDVQANIFASPQVEPINLEEALRKTGGSDVQKFIEAARAVEDQHGVQMDHSPATGVWEGGAEPSVISRTSAQGIDPDVLHTIAAIRGKAANQAAVLTWFDDDNGPQMRYTVDLTGVSPGEAAERVLKAGIENATVEKTATGTQIHIMDLGSNPESRAALENKLDEHFPDGDLHDQPGHGRLIWREAPTQSESKWTYDKVVENFTKRPRNLQTERTPAGDDNSAGEAQGLVGDTGLRTSPGMDEDRIRQLIQQGNVARTYSDDERQQLLNSYDPTQLTPKERELAAEIRDHFSDTLANAQAHGALGEGVQDYVTQLWDKDADNAAANKLQHDARNMSDFAINTPMARERMFANAFEGQLLGKKLAVTDPVALAAHNANTFGRVIAARDALARLQDNGTRASDGRPMVTLAGTGEVVQGRAGENPAALVNPFNIRNIRIADKVVRGLKASGDLDRMLEDGRITTLPSKDGSEIYAWNPNDYKTIDHPAMRGWNYTTTTPDGSDVLVKSDLRVHPEAYDYLNQRLGGDQSSLAKNGIGKVLLGANREGKGLLLFGSPFHLFQEGLRAVMTGVSPFGLENWDLRTDPVLRTGVENGLTLGTDAKSVQAYQEGLTAGHSKLLEKVPGLSQAQGWLQDFLFQKYIPGLKARAYRSLVDRYAAQYPDWTPDKVAETAAADTNERFGGINYKRIGRSAATQDIFRLASLAPDWLESEVRFMARSFGDEGAIARKDLVRIALGMWGTARVLNYLTTGQAHLEAPFGVAVKQKDGSEKVISIRTMPTDMLHAISDPGNFLAGRASPLFRSAVETYTGRDEYGRKVPTHNIAVNMLNSVAPIPLQSAEKAITGQSPELSNTDQLEKAGGLTVTPYQTEAGRLAASLASDRSSSGPVDPAQLRRHQAMMKFEDDLRIGAMSPQQVYDMVQDGDLAPTDAKTMMKTLQQTAGMPADLAKLYSRASRLPMPDLLKVWDAGTNTEKAALTPLIQKKMKSYYKDAETKLTPAERRADPTYQRLRFMFPNQAPF